jgi:hypothetical protein
VLVPHLDSIDVDTHEALQVLLSMGHQVRRLSGLPVDVARSVLAARALQEGFEEFLWVDSDIVFQPTDVERLRERRLPIVCGLYPKKGPAEFACSFVPNTKQVPFGKDGIVTEVRYAGFGFMLTRREVFEKIERELCLAICSDRSGARFVPFFMPMIVSEAGENRYLAEDYAFCERARRCGWKIMADTSVRLLHVGRYRYSWDDVYRALPS